jgi:hypothetical protein
MKVHSLLCCGGAAALLWLILAATPARGSILGMERLEIDCTTPECREKIRWSDSKIDVTKEGLGWDGPENASRDLWIEITQPLAVGLSWRPAQAVSIRAEIEAPADVTFHENGVSYRFGQLYARHSPDGHHWSSWQEIEAIPPTKEKPRIAYSGSLRVPYRERVRYSELLAEYRKLDVPWSSDEEAAVRWIVEREPDFFEKQIPFIGYIQFLYEHSQPGGARIKSLTFEAGFGLSGIHTIPKDQSVYKAHTGPWRYRGK